MGNPVVHFEVMGSDGDKLRTYFSELFGWTINAMGDMDYGIVDTGAEGGIGGGIGAQDGQGMVTFYVAVDDVAAFLEKAESLGGKTVTGPQQIPGGPEIGLFATPEGQVIGLVKNVEG